ncbi:CidA/LrgA family protein [Pseudodesulfovibrio sp.]|uniref:CidA/LrgA family protein n=1 Tax=unclassified Pseudodesulfovibrio TaxID=2661612 RepID=UPI003B008658
MNSKVALARVSFGRGMRTVFQLGFFIGLWWGCESLSRVCHLGIPGGILGLLILSGLLLSGWLPVSWISSGAGVLLDNLLLFFIPATMAVLKHPEFLGWVGLKVLAVVVLGVFLVMTGTAVAVDWHLSRRTRRVH